MININMEFNEHNFEKKILNHIKQSIQNRVGNLNCEKHPNKDTIIKIIGTDKIEINGCCPEFEQLLKN